MEGFDWAYLPEPVLAHIFSFLPLFERENIQTVCKNWKQSLDTPILWRRFVCSFFLPDDKKALRYMKQYGRYISHLIVELNQQGDFNRENAVMLLEWMAKIKDVNLSHLSLRFKGENPLFYAGGEFTTALTNLFHKCGEMKKFCKLSYVNLSGLQAKFTESFIDSLSLNCPNLAYLNILNKMLICNVSVFCVKRLVDRCRKLKILHVYHISINDEVLQSFTEENRTPLIRLGIVCRREEKYGEDISSTTWSAVVHTNPDLTVELGFDHTCPLHRVSEIMKPEIPVIELHLATFTRIYSEVDLASQYYKNSLEKLVVQTRPSKELDQALLYIARYCKKLQMLCVYCVVDKAVVQEIFSLCPDMKRRGTYILKWEMEPEPWTVGQEEGDWPS